jgi:hypothetical protein
MADTPDTTTCPDTSAGRDDSLSPFYALNYHFGMLLGVDDFATEQQYHHGKMRLHNAWLHRAGVVWGFDVLLGLEPDQIRVQPGEIRVLPGLALDASGHELHLDGDACVNVVEWFLAHKDDEGFAQAANMTTTPTTITFDAHVEIRFKSCLTRQVPALLEPCEAGSAGTAYSRVFETVDIQLLPGKAPAPATPPYHRLRVLFGLEDPLPADQPVVEARTAVLTLASEQQPAAYLQALRKFAALDEIDLQPAKSSDDTTRLLFPAPGDSPVILADITGITLDHSGASGSLKLTGGAVDVTVRPSHIATATLQELLCGPLFRNVGTSSTAAGPRVLPATVQITASDINFQLDKDLHVQSVSTDAFSITTFTNAAGWQDVAFTATLASGPPSVNLQLNTPLAAGMLVRFIAKGTGPKPLLGANLAPLAGAAGGPEPPPHDGLDFVFMQVRS